MAKDALALLREKDATIADYILQIAEMQKQIATQDRILTDFMKRKEIEADKDAEIERLQGAVEQYEQERKYHFAMSRKAQADAITEFAERLKKFYGILKGKTVGGSVEYHIDQIAKEMREKQ